MNMSYLPSLLITNVCIQTLHANSSMTFCIFPYRPFTEPRYCTGSIYERENIQILCINLLLFLSSSNNMFRVNEKRMSPIFLFQKKCKLIHLKPMTILHSVNIVIMVLKEEKQVLVGFPITVHRFFFRCFNTDLTAQSISTEIFRTTRMVSENTQGNTG